MIIKLQMCFGVRSENRPGHSVSWISDQRGVSTVWVTIKHTHTHTHTHTQVLNPFKLEIVMLNNSTRLYCLYYWLLCVLKSIGFNQMIN